MNVAVAVNDMVVSRSGSSNNSSEYLLQRDAPTSDDELVLTGTIGGSASELHHERGTGGGTSMCASLQDRSDASAAGDDVRVPTAMKRRGVSAVDVGVADRAFPRRHMVSAAADGYLFVPAAAAEVMPDEFDSAGGTNAAAAVMCGSKGTVGTSTPGPLNAWLRQSSSMGSGSISNAAAQACAASSSSSDVVPVHSPLQHLASTAAAEEECAAPRPRWCPTPDQIRILESFFNAGTTTPSREMIVDIAAQLRHYGTIAEANVFYWFQNRKARAKRKRQQFGVGGDCESSGITSSRPPPAGAIVNRTYSSSSAPPMPPSTTTMKANDRLGNRTASTVPSESALPPTNSFICRTHKKKKKKTASCVKTALPLRSMAACPPVQVVAPPIMSTRYSGSFQAASMPLETVLRCDVQNAATTTTTTEEGKLMSAPPSRAFAGTSMQVAGAAAAGGVVQLPPYLAAMPYLGGGSSHVFGSPPLRQLKSTTAAAALLMQQQQEEEAIAAAEAGRASCCLWADHTAVSAAAQDRQIRQWMGGEGESQMWACDDAEGGGACQSFLRATSQGLVLNIMSWDGKDMMNPSSASSLSSAAGFNFQDAAAPPTSRPPPSFSSPAFIQSLRMPLSSTPDQLLLSQYSLPSYATAEVPKLSSISSSTSCSLALPPAAGHGTEDHLQLWEELGSSCGSLTTTWREH